ncbi:MAG: RNA polymerase sigma factor [Polyangiaceae bacterium]|nr:RNA polymerase sigma factor [Polyangiaceae bacterium]
MEEHELNAAMDRYASGDPSAFGVLHRALAPRLYAYLVRMRGSAHVADDLVQETFLRMHRARATFSRGASVVPWMYTIARNVLIDHSRASRVRGKSEPLDAAMTNEPIDVAADTESAAVANQAARTVQRVLQRLPAAQREAFVLLRYEGLSVSDAADVLGATPSAVKLRAFRAYEALRAALAPSDEMAKSNTQTEAKPTSDRREEVVSERRRGSS